MTVSDSCVQFGFPGVNNIAIDPKFEDAVNDVLRLRVNSPCIDTGSFSSLPLDVNDVDEDADFSEKVPLDVAGNSRIADGNGDTLTVVDMGAHEFPVTSKTTVDTGLNATLNPGGGTTDPTQDALV